MLDRPGEMVDHQRGVATGRMDAIDKGERVDQHASFTEAKLAPMSVVAIKEICLRIFLYIYGILLIEYWIPVCVTDS